MRSPEAFLRFYESDLRPHLEVLEQKRKQVASQVVITGIAVVVIAMLLGVVVLNAVSGLGEDGPPWFFGAFGGLIVGAVTYAFLYNSITRGYIAEFKETIIGKIVVFVDPHLIYQKDDFIRQQVYMDSQLFLNSPDRYNGEDLVRGLIGQTAIEFSEVHAEYKSESTDSEGRSKTEWHTIFHGIFFVADFNKEFQGTTVVLPDVAQKLFGRVGQKLQSFNFTRKGELVKLEDPAFEERFVVYSDDQIEARYLLSTSLMERIVAYMDKAGKQLHLAFVASKLFVAVSYSENLFEPKLFRSIVDVNLVEHYLEDLVLAVDIVEDLHLNTRIWTKA